MSSVGVIGPAPSCSRISSVLVGEKNAERQAGSLCNAAIACGLSENRSSQRDQGEVLEFGDGSVDNSLWRKSRKMQKTSSENDGGEAADSGPVCTNAT